MGMEKEMHTKTQVGIQANSGEELVPKTFPPATSQICFPQHVLAHSGYKQYVPQWFSVANPSSATEITRGGDIVQMYYQCKM